MSLKSLKNNSGLTMVELIVVVTVIGLVAAISLSAVKIGRQKDLASEAARVSNIKKAAEAIEAYRVLEKSYPSMCDKNDPSYPPTECNDALAEIIVSWPNDLEYYYDDVNSEEFSLYTKSPVLEETYFKYSSAWKGSDDQESVKDCGSLDIKYPDVCLDVGVSDDMVATGIEVVLTSNSIQVGKTTPAKSYLVYSNGYKSDVTSGSEWISKKTSIATVSQNGSKVFVKGVSSGTSKIEAKYQDFKGDSTITVTEPPPTYELIVSANPTSIQVNQSSTLKAMYGTQNVTLSPDTIWESLNPSILRINKTSTSVTATGLAPGEGTVKATYQGSNVDTVGIGVISAPTTPPQQKTLSSIVIEPGQAYISRGQTSQLRSYAVYSDGSRVEVSNLSTWSSSKTAVATVNGSGLVTGITRGFSGITASYTESGITKSSTAIVYVN